MGERLLARKSDLAAPGVPSLRMEITESNRRTRPAPFSGGFANGGAQTPDVKNPVDAYESEITLRLLGRGSGCVACNDRDPITPSCSLSVSQTTTVVSEGAEPPRSRLRLPDQRH